MDFFEVIEERASVRSFVKCEVPEEERLATARVVAKSVLADLA